jgi:multiple sugar transport system permease protein
MTTHATDDKPGTTGRHPSPHPTRRRPRMRRPYSTDSPRRSMILTVVMCAILLYFLIPLWWLFVSSTKSNGDLFSTFGLRFSGDNQLWTNIKAVFTADDGVYLLWLRNSFLYSVISAVGAAFLATMAGYAFAKYRFPGGNLIFSGILGAIMIPMTALTIPTYLLFANAGLTNTPWAVILPSLVSPFGVFLMRVYAADAVDDNLIEAARVDGASELRIFFQVSLRLLGPGMVTVLLFALVATWNNYFLPLIMLNSPNLYPLTVGLAQWQSAASSAGSGGQAQFSSIITGSFLSIIPLVIAFLFLQRYWQSGLASGAVKG